MNKLKFWRIERGLTQHELAQAAEVSRWAIHLAEMGIKAPRSEQKAALAMNLGVAEEMLFPIGAKTDRERRDPDTVLAP